MKGNILQRKHSYPLKALYLESKMIQSSGRMKLAYRQKCFHTGKKHFGTTGISFYFNHSSDIIKNSFYYDKEAKIIGIMKWTGSVCIEKYKTKEGIFCDFGGGYRKYKHRGRMY